jgi:hypothetical protein
MAATKAPYTAARPTPTLSRAGTVAATGPGQPYTAAAVEPYFATPPEALPDALKTRGVAEALAGRIWTYDGRPYRMLWLGATCENQRCEISATGLPTFAPTTDYEDVFFVSLDQRTGVFGEAHAPSLKGFPPELTPDIDRLARSLDTVGQFSGLPLLGMEWVIPPPDRTFTLRYGRGNEEGDPTYLVTVSIAEHRIISVRST